MNPFDVNIDNNFLFNISTGKATSKCVEEFLLNIKEEGNRARENFITECSLNADRFEQRIQRTKIMNFASQIAKIKVKAGENVQKIQMQRDLFRRILGLSLDYAVD